MEKIDEYMRNWLNLKVAYFYFEDKLLFTMEKIYRTKQDRQPDTTTEKNRKQDKRI